jgi:hypothetical protein
MIVDRFKRYMKVELVMSLKFPFSISSCFKKLNSSITSCTKLLWRPLNPTWFVNSLYSWSSLYYGSTMWHNLVTSLSTFYKAVTLFRTEAVSCPLVYS